MKHTIQAILLTLTVLAFAAAAPAEEVFVHFENLAPGTDLATDGVLPPNLSIQQLNQFDSPPPERSETNALRVIETFDKGEDRSLTIFKAPNTTDWPENRTNSGLEDENGNKIDTEIEGTARGFANTDCSWINWDDDYWCPQELKITFGQRRVYKFQMLMVDSGDWNPGLTSDHRILFRGLADGQEIDYTIEYQTEPTVTPQTSTLGPGIDPRIDSDSVSSQGSGLGHKYLVLHAPSDSNGFEEIQLWASDPDLVITDPLEACRTGGCDPNVAFDSLRIDYVNLVDMHTLSCPNPLNLGGNGVLPVAVLGTAEFDVTQVMPDTCRLEGASPRRWHYADTSRPYVAALVDENSCTGAGPDGWDDLNLKFRNRDVAAGVGSVPPGTVVTLDLVCTLANGDEFRSEDIMKIVG